MDPIWRTIIWQQFGAAIDMLENAMHACPDDLWSDRSQRLEFWYVVYHTLFWLDLYLSGAVEGFAPPVPFTLDELDPAGLLPERPYTKAELQAYLDHDRQKCRSTLAALTDEQAQRLCEFSWGKAISF
ncbi:MAG TPA: DinB family protein, partial [Anaerolineae bacterium]